MNLILKEPKSRSRHEKSVLLPAVVLSLAALGGAGVITSSVIANSNLNDAAGAIHDVKDASQLTARIIEQQKQLEYNIILIQESVEDISATRGFGRWT